MLKRSNQFTCHHHLRSPLLSALGVCTSASPFETSTIFVQSLTHPKRYSNTSKQHIITNNLFAKGTLSVYVSMGEAPVGASRCRTKSNTPIPPRSNTSNGRFGRAV